MLQYATNGEAFDFPEYDSFPQVRYVLSSTPRSGSNMLTRALWHTQRAGFPEEYFTDAYVQDFIERWGFNSDENDMTSVALYVQRLMRCRTSPNGVFGVKLHAGHLGSQVLQGSDVHILLCNPRYIWIKRRDRIRQAISYLLAQQTGIWIIDGIYLENKPSSGKAVYSFEGIARCLNAIDSDVHTWERYFSSRQISPHVLLYEDLVENYEETIHRCLTYLGVDSPEIVPLPGIERQAGQVTNDWYMRFTSDPRFTGTGGER